MNGNEAKDLVGKPKAKEWPSMKVLFPSLATVTASELGREVSCRFPSLGCQADMKGRRDHVYGTELESGYQAFIP
jgi:hypothetical protein